MLALSEPMVRLVFERGEFDAESTRLTAEALFWFSFSLPFSGFVLMLTRGFFALQRPWIPTTLAVGSLAINAIGSYLLAGPFGIGGIVIGTTLSNVALVIAEAIWLRRALGGFETAGRCWRSRRCWSGRPSLARVAYGVWWGLDDLLGESLIGPDRLRRHRARGRQRGLRGGRSGPPDPRGTADRRPVCLAACGVARNLRVLWPTRSTSGTSRSSPTSTMGSRRWPIASWS